MNIRRSGGWCGTLLVAVCIIIMSGCATSAGPDKPAAVPELRPGAPAGYIFPMKSLPDSLALIPPPPAPGSAAFALDEDVSRKTFALRGTPRFAQADLDYDLNFPRAAGTFSCALNAPITEQDTPYLYQLLRRTVTDAAVATYAAKNHYKRKRPFQLNHQPMCAPGAVKHLEKSASYPSGHTSIGWTWALILTEIAPERTDVILHRARTYAESRNICNHHWYSDVVWGYFIGAAVAARLHAEPAFRADLEKAREELAAVHAKGLKPTRDCQAEAAALAIKLPLEPSF